MTVLDDQGKVFTNLSGTADANGFCDYPDASQEGVVISLLDTNGNQLPPNYYDMTLTTYPVSTLAESKSAAYQANAAGSGGTSSGLLRVEDPELILRKPLEIPILAELLSQTNAPAATNAPTKQ
jgi:hypothetical protein